MFECFRGGAGEVLTRADYLADFSRVHKSGISLLAKIERGQTFKEQGSPSWEAFASGDWAGALRLIEEERDSVAPISGMPLNVAWSSAGFVSSSSRSLRICSGK